MIVKLDSMGKTVISYVHLTVLTTRHVVRRMLNAPMDVLQDTIHLTLLNLVLVTAKMENATGTMGSVLVNGPWDIMVRLVMNSAQRTMLTMHVTNNRNNVVKCV